MPIQTARLTLRCFTEADYEMLRELDGDPAVLRHRSRQHIGPEMTRKFLEQAQGAVQDSPRLFYAYAVIQSANRDWLGQCGLTVLNRDATEAFAWYSLLPRHWGQGYMGEALRALLYAGATEFNLRRILAECHANHRASIRVMEKAGMRYEGQIHLPNTQGQSEDRVRYALEGDELMRLNDMTIRIESPL